MTDQPPAVHHAAMLWRHRSLVATVHLYSLPMLVILCTQMYELDIASDAVLHTKNAPAASGQG